MLNRNNIYNNEFFYGKDSYMENTFGKKMETHTAQEFYVVLVEHKLCYIYIFKILDMCTLLGTYKMQCYKITYCCYENSYFLFSFSEKEKGGVDVFKLNKAETLKFCGVVEINLYICFWNLLLVLLNWYFFLSEWQNFFTSK